MISCFEMHFDDSMYILLPNHRIFKNIREMWKT